MYESNDKMVSHPDHYQSETGLEVIDVIEAFTFDLTGIEAVDTGNVLKYICRWKKKNGLQDLEKAKWYLQHLIDHVEKLEEENKKAYPTYIFETRKETEKVLDYMLDMIRQYGVITEAKLREYCGMTIDVDHHELGWKNIDNVTIDTCDAGYYLVLPEPTRFQIVTKAYQKEND